MAGIGGISTLVLILILSFAIDRVVKAVLFLLSFAGLWMKRFPDPLLLEDPTERAKAEKQQKLIYYLFAGFLGLIVVAIYGNVRVFRALGYQAANVVLDAIVTGIILMAGSEVISKVLQISGMGGASESTSQPIEITGKLILENKGSTKPDE
jgi:hypothetical protein